jgi:hypothetical protein
MLLHPARHIARCSSLFHGVETDEIWTLFAAAEDGQDERAVSAWGVAEERMAFLFRPM